MSFLSRRIYPGGDIPLKGVEASQVTNTYYWHRVAGTEFCACVVIENAYPGELYVQWNRQLWGIPPVILVEGILDPSMQDLHCSYYGTIAVRST